MVLNILLGILVIFLIANFSLFHPAATGKIADGLYAVDCLFVNFYVLTYSGGAVVFDTGMNAGIAKRALGKLGVSPDAVTHVFLTHSDFDHAGALSAFPNATIYISEEEEQMVNGKKARRGFMRNSLSRPYHTIADGETVAAGDLRIKLILAPGHTPGSSVYSVDDGRILATGDLLRVTRKGVSAPFLWMMNMDHAQDIKSIEATRNLTDSAQYILSGHTGVRAKNA